MRRHWPILLIALLLPAPAQVGAQTSGTPYRIGVLTASWGATPAVVGLIEGLERLGYKENEDFVVGVRFTQGDIAELPAAARQMVDRGVDMLFTIGEPETKAAQQATSTHPIVFEGVGDPVGQGVVDSYARPGRNTTGVADLNNVVGGKRLQLFAEMVPGLKRILFPYNKNNPYHVDKAASYQEEARRLDLVFVGMPLTALDEARDRIAKISSNDIDGVVAPRDVDLNIPGFVLEAGTQRGIPTMFDTAFYVEEGGVASYGGDGTAAGRQAARLVDKIMHGADAGLLPVEVDQALSFVLNLKAAATIGVEIPREVIYQADEIMR